MKSGAAPLVPGNTTGAEDVEGAIRAFTGLLGDLGKSYALLEGRAERVEAELSVANKRLEAILASLPTGVLVVGTDGRIVRANRAAAGMLAVDADDLKGSQLPESVEALPSDGAPAPLRSADAVPRVVSRRTSEVRMDDGELLGTLEILDDRTELTRVTERMHRQSKMAALGTVAGGIAHEVRNPMSAIRGFAALLRRKAAADAELLRYAATIEEGVVEVDAIISSVLAFATPERLVPRTVGAREIVAAAIELVRRDHDSLDDESIECRVSDVAFTGDAIQLRQALRNLIDNAIRAQETAGRVLVRADRCGSFLEFAVEDAGPGIETRIAERARDPFFTTRPEGTGLGLALVDTIARLHGGELEIATEPSSLGGARVVLRIPLNSEPSSKTAPEPSGRTERE